MDGDVEYTPLMPGGFKKYNRQRDKEARIREQASQIKPQAKVIKKEQANYDPTPIKIGEPPAPVKLVNINRARQKTA